MDANFAIWQKADKDEFVGVRANVAKSFSKLQDFYLFWHETCSPENSATIENNSAKKLI